jgi:hypothetical protein
MLSGGRPAHPITGRGGKSIDAVWAHGPQTYLGLTVAGFLNMFLVTGPGSPSVLSNMTVSIEQHVDWVVDRLIAMRATGFSTNEATETAQAGWARHLADCTALSLHRLANTWYTGANVPSKARGVMPYTGGVGPYRTICDEVVSRGMLGFKLTGPNGARQCNDGEIVRLQPDVRLVLGMLADLKLPPIESLGAPGGAPSSPSSTRRVPPVGRSARSSTGRSTVPAVHWPTVSIGLPRRVRIRSSSTSTAVAGCWATQTDPRRLLVMPASGPRRISQTAAPMSASLIGHGSQAQLVIHRL